MLVICSWLCPNLNVIYIGAAMDQQHHMFKGTTKAIGASRQIILIHLSLFMSIFLLLWIVAGLWHQYGCYLRCRNCKVRATGCIRFHLKIRQQDCQQDRTGPRTPFTSSVNESQDGLGWTMDRIGRLVQAIDMYILDHIANMYGLVD